MEKQMGSTWVGLEHTENHFKDNHSTYRDKHKEGFLTIND